MKLLSGKNKEQFEEWYLKDVRHNRKDYIKFSNDQVLRKFYRVDFKMKIGVYLAYYDSLGIYINVEFYKASSPMAICSYKIRINKPNEYKEYFEHTFQTRNEAYKSAFKEANKIVNQDN